MAYLDFSDWRVGGTLASYCDTPRVMRVVNRRHGDMLGVIYWYPAWRRHVMRSWSSVVWSAGCLGEVEAKLEQLDDQRRKGSHGWTRLKD